jgi:hypothetical protein
MAEAERQEKSAMKKIWIYVILIAGAIAVREKSVKLGEMKPVEVVYLHERLGRITVETDTGDKGEGESVKDAIKNLEDTTAGELLLDTADYLIVTENLKRELEAIKPYLKNDTMVCSVKGVVKMNLAAEYLNAHKPNAMLKKLHEVTHLQQLICEENSMILK